MTMKGVNVKWFMSLDGCDVGDHTLKKYVGRGKIGYVYRALSKTVPDWEVAVKIIAGRPRAGWDNELKKVSRLSTIHGVVHLHHIGAGQITRAGNTEVFQYTVWDYIPPGRNLRQYLMENAHFPTSFLLAVVEEILKVLHACHAKSMRHGDLHAGNILVGEPDDADLDASYTPRQPIYVSDFGFGTSGGKKKPKDDYQGLAEILNILLQRVEWDAATVTDRHIIKDIGQLGSKLLREASETERRTPLELLRAVEQIKRRAYSFSSLDSDKGNGRFVQGQVKREGGIQVGQFQVSEMLGDDWGLWRRLFVPSVPAKSRILEPDISTVVTGPRGCGKTMLLRRLSARLIVECGPVDNTPESADFVGLYVNANDFGDAFAHFPDAPTESDVRKLTCYANLCILSDLLSVISAKDAKDREEVPPELLAALAEWFVGGVGALNLVVGEESLERYRAVLEKLKWKFPGDSDKRPFPGYNDLSQHVWLRQLIALCRRLFPWISKKAVLVFIDDFSTPRISSAMQRTLNRIFFQRTSEFVCKIATESATTFVAEDSSGKVLQDGDDYQLIDIGEESLFLSEKERSSFLCEVFERRLSLDPRVPHQARSLPGLLGSSGLSKTEFARLLRQPKESTGQQDVEVKHEIVSQRRGATRPKALYNGANMFASLWSGDTRIMIQLVQDLIDEAQGLRTAEINCPIEAEIQDRVFRNRGGQWLETQTRNQPTSPDSVESSLRAIRQTKPEYQLTGGNYGTHLKAVVEAFVHAARNLLLGPMYAIEEGGSIRYVPKMAFRIEIIDDFRVHDLAAEIYKDMIRYGIFMRDARGKSVRGAMVPRLYLRRFLLPYCTLALSKRDSVQLTCASFVQLLLSPDGFRADLPTAGRRAKQDGEGQLVLPGPIGQIEVQYDDLQQETREGPDS